MPGPVFLEGERVTLNLVEPDDFEFLVGLWNNKQVRYQAGWPQTPLTEDDIVDSVEDEDTIHFLPCIDGNPVGHVSFSPLNLEARNAELGYGILPDEEGNGYATEAADLCLTHAFDELGLQKVYARVLEGNEASMQVLEKLGFQQEGVLRKQDYVFGDYVDEYRFGLLRSER